MTLITGLVVIVMAATMDLSQIVELANVGTLTAFIAVAVSMLVLRVRDPNRPRVFKTPLPWVVGPVCILGCLYLAWSLPTRTQIWFFEWNGMGLVVYFLYGIWASRLAKASR
jgi:APA family basic amino acid/polyamine antiporter